MEVPASTKYGVREWLEKPGMMVPLKSGKWRVQRLTPGVCFLRMFSECGESHQFPSRQPGFLPPNLSLDRVIAEMIILLPQHSNIIYRIHSPTSDTQSCNYGCLLMQPISWKSKKETLMYEIVYYYIRENSLLLISLFLKKILPAQPPTLQKWRVFGVYLFSLQTFLGKIEKTVSDILFVQFLQ